MEISEQVILDKILAGIFQVVEPDQVLLFGAGPGMSTIRTVILMCS